MYKVSIDVLKDCKKLLNSYTNTPKLKNNVNTAEIIKELVLRKKKLNKKAKKLIKLLEDNYGV